VSLSFGWEKLSDLIRDPAVKALIAEHFEEIAEDKNDCPLDVQWDHYLSTEAKGILRVWAARADGGLAGYVCWFVDRHPCYRAIYAWASPFYLAPEYRTGWNGVKLLTGAEKDLKALGVRRLVVHEKVSSPLGPIFERARYRLYERSHTKLL
jgi:GNAT superfamily N-acetyltransferase